jgi:surface polysaccharide O-acyltransferase-like enzyme
MARADAPAVVEALADVAPVPEVAARFEGLDLLRLLAVIAVVVLHVFATEAADVGGAGLSVVVAGMRWAVPALFALAGLLSVPSAGRPAGAYLGRRVVRLGVPYAFWVAAYLAAGAVFKTPHVPTLMELFFRGGSEYGFHLWFLTTLLLCAPITLIARSWKVGAVVVGIGAAMLLGRYLGGWRTPLDLPISLGYPFLNWLEVYAAGVLAGHLLAARPRLTGSATSAGVTMICACLGAVAAYVLWGGTSALTYVVVSVAALALVFAFRFPATFPDWVHTACTMSLGVYLVHPMIHAAWGQLVKAPLLPPLPWAIVSTVVVLTGSTAVALVLLRLPPMKRFVT